MGGPYIVMCAPNGARRNRKDHAALPITPEELAECAGEIVDAGASIMHVHVRDDSGRHSLDARRYRAAIDAIREQVDDRLVIQVTTEACGIYTPDTQMALIRELRPEAASVALREITAAGEGEAAAFYAWMCENGVMAQHILYSPDEVRRFESLRAADVIPDPRPFVLFVLGRYAENLTGNVGELDAYIDAAAADTTWAVCCFGRTEHEAVVAAAAKGGHARVGFENNLWLQGGEVADDNAALVSLATRAGEAAGRPVASAADVRQMFG
ncbi:MAG: 3-keto-5-aminohexanoate cleavage protein [Gammaproteobacteria bacterium]|nr:3-keto-5-aminohexanoate cleavage protein [Gammaproteobacteria bacterium]